MTREQINLLQLIRQGLGESVQPVSVDDWKSVLSLAAQQGMSAIVLDGCSQLYDSTDGNLNIPTPVLNKLIAASFNFKQLFTIQQKAAANLADLFARNNIRTYILKGYVVAECYPEPKHRRSSDFDCFLLPTQGEFDATNLGDTLIDTQGIHVNRAYYKNSSFLFHGLTVENHRFLTPFRGNNTLRKLEILLQKLIRSDEGNDKIEGTDLVRPPVMASALFLVEHAYSHFLHEGLTIRHITDWMMFSQFHRDNIDWPIFLQYINDFGFRKFYDAYLHLGELIMGRRQEETLTKNERRMLDSVWKGLELHPDVHGFKSKLALAGNTLRAAWKYRHFSPISMPHALWIQVKSYFFDKHPILPISS